MKLKGLSKSCCSYHWDIACLLYWKPNILLPRCLFLLLCCFTQMLYLSLVPTARFRSPKDYNDNEASKNLFLHVFSTTSSLKHPICTCSENKINLVNHHLESLSSKFQGIHHIPIVIGPIKVLNIKKNTPQGPGFQANPTPPYFCLPFFFRKKWP